MPWSSSAALRFVAGGMLAYAAVHTVSELLDPIAPTLRARVAIFRERAGTVEAVAVGNSHGATVKFAELGMRGMHFAQAGQDAFEAVHLARYGASAPRLRYVLFAASYGVQRVDHAVVGSADLRAFRRYLYARTPLQRPIPGDLDLWVTGMLAPVVRDDHWSGVAARLYRARRPVLLHDDGGPAGLVDRTPMPRDSLALHGAVVGGHHTRRGAEMIALAPATPTRVAGMLGDLARELRARGAALVLYTPPYHETYLRMHNPAVNAEKHAIMRRIAAENPNVVWLDYSTDPRFTHRDELFTNSDHLNQAGGRAFSRLLGECMRASLAGEKVEPGRRGCPVSVAL